MPFFIVKVHVLDGDRFLAFFTQRNEPLTMSLVHYKYPFGNMPVTDHYWKADLE